MTTDRELMQQALDLLDDINQCSLPPTGIPLPAEIDHVIEALRARLAQPEQKPVATLFGSLPVYDVPPAKPVAWVETLENARPHCVTDLKYCSVAQHERGEHLKYIPLYTAPPKIFCGCGDQIMPDDGAECGNCVTARNAVKPEPVAQVHVAEDYYPHVIWAEGINAVCFDQEYLYITPPQREWQGLTDEDIEQIHYGIKCKGIGAYSTNDIYRAIEAKLKEKNNA